jgi:hypothetical protein
LRRAHWPRRRRICCNSAPPHEPLRRVRAGRAAAAGRARGGALCVAAREVIPTVPARFPVHIGIGRHAGIGAVGVPC